MLVEEHPHASIFQFEPGIDKFTVFGDARPRTRKVLQPGDAAGLDVVCDLGEVAARMCEAHGKRLRFGLVSPLDAPQSIACVADGDARLRTGEVFLDEAVRGHRCPAGAARAEAQLGGLGERRFAPDAMADRDEPARTRAPDLPPAAEMPYEIDRPHGRNCPRTRQHRVPEELLPVHAIAICKNVPVLPL